jgi:D-aminopeptidase
MAHASGDYAIGFTTSRAGLEGYGSIGMCLPEQELTPLFLATVEAVEEAVYDALFSAEDLQGRDGAILYALPKERVVDIIRRFYNGISTN